jgi:hypothetical protein
MIIRWTEEEVLKLARRLHGVTVHRFNNNQAELRQLTRRMCEAGRLRQMPSARHEFIYKEPLIVAKGETP